MICDVLRNLSFKLIENDDGHASESTVMTFDESINPNKAVYSGANVLCGQVLVQDNIMLYQSVSHERILSAGRAIISLDNDKAPRIMTLNWRWLTGDLSQGISIWHKIDKLD